MKSLTGKKQSVETRIKHRNAMKGRSGQFQKGQEAWNKKNGIEPIRKTKRVGEKVIPQAHYVYMKYHGLYKIPDGFVIHHRDENPLNNKISNLRLMRREDHLYLHQVLDRERFNFNQKVLRLKKELGNKVSLSATDKGWIDYILNEIFGSELT